MAERRRKSKEISAAAKAENFIRKLISEKLSNGEENLPSEWELAGKLGISRSSVHQALEVLVREKLLYKIPGKGTFISHLQGGGRMMEGKKIGVILPNVHIFEQGAEAFWFNFHDIFEGIAAEADVYGSQAQICVCRPDMSEGQTLDWLHSNFIKNSFDAMAVINCSGYERLIAEASKANIPAAGWHLESALHDRVFVDYFPAMHEAVTCLLNSGRERIVFLGRTSTHCGAGDKTRGYLKALEDFGLVPDEEMIVNIDDYAGYTFSAVSSIIRSGREIEAVVASNDIMAMDAICALRENGISVPDEVAVTGSDDMPGVEEFSPPLATLKVPRFQVGGLLFQLVKNRIMEPGTEPTVLTVGAQFILRGSAGKEVMEENFTASTAG